MIDHMKSKFLPKLKQSQQFESNKMIHRAQFCQNIDYHLNCHLNSYLLNYGNYITLKSEQIRTGDNGGGNQSKSIVGETCTANDTSANRKSPHYDVGDKWYNSLSAVVLNHNIWDTTRSQVLAVKTNNPNQLAFILRRIEKNGKQRSMVAEFAVMTNDYVYDRSLNEQLRSFGRKYSELQENLHETNVKNDTQQIEKIGEFQVEMTGLVDLQVGSCKNVLDSKIYEKYENWEQNGLSKRERVQLNQHGCDKNEYDNIVIKGKQNSGFIIPNAFFEMNDNEFNEFPSELLALDHDSYQGNLHQCELWAMYRNACYNNYVRYRVKRCKEGIMVPDIVIDDPINQIPKHVNPFEITEIRATVVVDKNWLFVGVSKQHRWVTSNSPKGFFIYNLTLNDNHLKPQFRYYLDYSSSLVSIHDLLPFYLRNDKQVDIFGCISIVTSKYRKIGQRSISRIEIGRHCFQSQSDNWFESSKSVKTITHYEVPDECRHLGDGRLKLYSDNMDNLYLMVVGGNQCTIKGVMFRVESNWSQLSMLWNLDLSRYKYGFQNKGLMVYTNPHTKASVWTLACTTDDHKTPFITLTGIILRWATGRRFIVLDYLKLAADECLKRGNKVKGNLLNQMSILVIADVIEQYWAPI